MLPGFPFGGLAAGGIEFVTSAAAFGATITIPAAAQAGDLAVLFDWSIQASGPTSVIPAGWTQIGTDLSGAEGAVKHLASRKTLAAGEPGTSVTGMSGSLLTKQLLVFRPSAASAGTWGATASNNQVMASNTPPANQTVSVGAEPYIVLASWGANIDIVTAGFSPTEDRQIGASGDRLVKFKIFNQSPAAVTVSCPGNPETSGWASLRSFRIPLVL